jgi:hypothetical protein
MLCDTETCDTCHAATVEGNDQNGECKMCAGDTSLDHMLRLMASGLTRNRVNGQFERINRR